MLSSVRTARLGAGAWWLWVGIVAGGSALGCACGGAGTGGDAGASADGGGAADGATGRDGGVPPPEGGGHDGRVVDGALDDAGGLVDAGGSTLARIELSTIVDDVPFLASYHSHNPKVVCLGRDCFLAHLEHRTDTSDTRQDVFNIRFRRSRDAGATFVSMALLENRVARPPAVVADPESGAVFFLAPHDVWVSDGPAWLYRYGPADGYAAPEVTASIPQGSAGKFTAFYDEFRDQLYYFTHNSTLATPYPSFFVLDRDGAVVRALALTSSTFATGPFRIRGIHYPYLAMHGSTLVAAWTTTNGFVPLIGRLPPYESIHAIRSEDGGGSWTTLGGAALALPIPSAVDGPATRITSDEESTTYGTTTHKWLSGFEVTAAGVHFSYLAGAPLDAQRYVRVERADGSLARTTPWEGARVRIHGQSSVFVRGGSELVAVGFDGGSRRLVALRSADDGRTWADHAVSDALDAGCGAYAVDVHRRPLAGGEIVGVFTRDCGDGVPRALVRFSLGPP
jgi:hypothetical protein